MIAGPFRVDFALQVDQLTVVMLLVVTFVGMLIHIYSTGYMAHEGGYYRFFCYLNLFMFFMLTLVLAANLIVMFVGWEGVGLCSYLLIGFWFLKKSAADAGKKAFITTRIGDFGFTVGILLVFCHLRLRRTSSTIFQSVSTNPVSQSGVLTTICLLLFTGAIGKSAQLPLYVWLPDAMEGPTPVSALIHAATMVTAGVYMVARMNPLFSRAPIAMLVVAIVGARHRVLLRHHRPRADRHQKSSRLLHRLAARLHVPGLRRGRVRRRHLPSDDPRLLQGPALPRAPAA